MEKLFLKSYFLVKLNFLNNENVFKNLVELLKEISKDDFEQILKKYNAFLCSIQNENLSELIKKQILKKNFKYDEISNELEIIKEILSFDYNSLKDFLLKKFPTYKDIINQMPPFKNFKNSKIDFNKDEFNLKDSISRTFIFDKNLELVPVETNETLTFYNLKGYSEQKKILYENTLALMNNKKVNNILLYGDAGCGKSSSVRALINEFKDLRIVQIFKDNLINLDKLYLTLKNLPYKFIIFADDISFDENDTNLSTMKAILEGSIITCPDNAVIYATTNRRHLVKESFKSRQGDEIHLNDTINEITSLSDRFGISLFFQKPSFEEFKQIVLELAKDNDINDENIVDMAKKLAIVKGSYAPRVARQLIDSIISKVDLF